MHNKLIKAVKKALTVGVSVATIGWSVGIAAPVSFAAVSGDLIKITCTGANQSVCSAVYYLGANNRRYVFPNEKTYKTWYADFSSVKNISQTEMESYPIGGNVTYRPGTRMIKIQTDPKVYAVEKNGTLRWVTSEAVASALYGSDWNRDIDDVPDPFFVNYTIGADITSSTQYDSVAQMTGSPTINADKSLGTSTTPVGGSTLTVALAADTPASGLVFGSSSRVPFTTFTVTASSDGDVTVDSITMERGGLAQDASFTNFDLLDASNMLPLNNLSKTLNADHRALFGDDFVVRAGTTRKLILAANMASGALSSYAGEVPHLAVITIVLKGGATLVGTLPVAGNYQTINGTLTAGTGAITVGANNPSATTKEVGTKDYIVSSIKITNNSSATNQDFRLRSVTWTQNGSAGPEDLENVKLVNANSGQVLGTVAVPASKEVSFTNLDLLIAKGNNITLDLRLDIKGGSARTISLDIDQQSDVVIFDTLRGVNVLPTYTNSANTTISTSPRYNAPDTTVGNGKLRVESLAIAQTNIAENTDQLLLGKFKFVVEGETLNITALGFNFTTTTPGAGTGAVTNVFSKDANGNTLTSTVDPATLHGVGTLTSQKSATSTDTVSLPVGEHTINVYGDLDSNFASNDTIQVGVHPEAITVRGDVSGNLITPTPSGVVQSTQLTVKPAALVVSRDTTPSAQTVVAGGQDFEFARIILDASDSGADVRITQANIVVDTTGAAFPALISGIELWDGATKIPIGSTSQTCAGATCSSTATQATTTLTISVGNLRVSRSTTKVLSVRGDIGTGATSGTFFLDLQGVNFTAVDQDGQTVTPTYTTNAGASMTLVSAGTLLIAFATDPASALAIAGSATDAGKFTLNARYEGLRINALGFSVQNPDGGIVGNADEVSTIELWEQGGSSSLGSVTVNASTATITPVTAIPLTLNQEKTYIVKIRWENLLPPSSGSPAESGAGVRLRLTYVDVDGVSAASGTVTVSPSGIDSATGNFNTFTMFKSLPTFALTSYDGSNAVSGNVTLPLFKFNVRADAAGPIAVGKFTFGISTTTASLNRSNYELWESSSASSDGILLSNTNDFQISDPLGANETILMARFDVNNDDTAARNAIGLTEHLMIAAGTTRYFVLKGLIAGHDGTADNETVSVRMAGDASFASTTQEPFGNAVDSNGIDGQVDQDDFIWSDLNFDQYSTSTATYTQGWYNGYRVPGLANTTSTAQSVTD